MTVMEEVLEVLEEVKRLNAEQAERSAKWASLAKRARAGEDVRHEADLLSTTVTDYGDVWVRLVALQPKVKKAVKAEARPAR